MYRDIVHCTLNTKVNILYYTEYEEYTENKGKQYVQRTSVPQLQRETICTGILAQY